MCIDLCCWFNDVCRLHIALNPFCRFCSRSSNMNCRLVVAFLLFALAPEISPAQSFWKVFANMHTDGISSLIVKDDGFIMASESSCYVVSNDNGVHWQGNCFPILIGTLCEPETGTLVSCNGTCYTNILFNCNIDEPDAYLIKYEGDTTWSAASGDYSGYINAGVGNITAVQDSALIYTSSQTEMKVTGRYDSVVLHCITPTRVFDPLDSGIEIDRYPVFGGKYRRIFNCWDIFRCLYLPRRRQSLGKNRYGFY